MWPRLPPLPVPPRRQRRPARFLPLVLTLLLGAACGAPEGDAPGGAVPDEVPDDTLVATPTDTLAGDTTTVPDTAGMPRDTTTRPAGAAAVEGLTTVHPWTIGIVDEPDPERGLVTVRSLEVAALPEIDRIVVTMDGQQPPGYHVEYVDTPLHECGSGREIHPPGDGWLKLRLTAARGHTEAGEATLTRQVETPELRVVQRIDRTCDFEGIVELVLAVSSPNAFRLSVAENPNRLVLDVRHGGGDG